MEGVGEAHLARHRRHRLALAQQFRRPHEALLLDPPPRRQAGFSREQARKTTGRQADVARQQCHRQAPRELARDAFASRADARIQHPLHWHGGMPPQQRRMQAVAGEFERARQVFVSSLGSVIDQTRTWSGAG